jgi:hypothetical protein
MIVRRLRPCALAQHLFECRRPAAREGSVRRRIEFDAETFHALDRLAKNRMQTLQELADEAFRDLLKKHRRRRGP